MEPGEGIWPIGDVDEGGGAEPGIPPCGMVTECERE